MEKIVVLSSGSESESKLIECLKRLFPECEIEIQEKMPGNDEASDIIFEHDDELDLNEDIEKYLSFL